MNWDLLFIIIFFIILYGIYFLYREKFHNQGIFVMYRTKLGLKLMNRLAKKVPRLLKIFSFVGIIFGYSGMAFIFYFLVKGVIDLIFVTNALPVVSPLLPGIEIAPGLPVLSFWHWIIGILIIATIHEFSHGVYARLYKVKIKSSGFAFFGPILAAFVEPDEKQLMKKNKKKQLGVLVAGPFSNVITGFIFLGIFFLLSLFIFSGLNLQGITIAEVNQNLPINNSGLAAGDIITNIDGVEIVNLTQVEELIGVHKPGEIILFGNVNKTWNVHTTSNSENATLIGISFISYYGEFGLGTKIGAWFIELFFWLWVMSFGVGLFNLLPLGPVDGGRMFYLACLGITKDKNKAERIWKAVSFFCLALILINLLPWIVKLFTWLLGI